MEIKLGYSLIFYNENTHVGAGGSMEINLVVTENYVGTRQGRIYLDGSVAPAFQNLVNGRLEATGLVNDLYVVEYKDDNGERILGKVRVFDLATSCFADAGAERGMIGYIQVSSTEFRVWTNIRPTSNAAREISIDGGVTWKSTLNANAHLVWSTGELEALGVDRSVPSVRIRRTSNACTMIQAESIIVVQGYAPMTAEADVTNCTAAGANDGAINLVIAGGSGNRTYAWGDGPVTQNRVNLAPGLYSVTITDITTGEIIVINDIEVTEPQAVPPPNGTLLEFPILNDLQWVVDPVDPGATPDEVTLDNVLFEDQVFGKYQKTCYFQKVVNTDLRIVQFNSDFSAHLIEIYDYVTKKVVKSFNAILKEQNLGVVEDFGIDIKNHVDNPGKSRVYFTGNTGGLPIALNVGDIFEVLNNLEGFNGSYSIVAIENDIFLNTNYLVITLNYTGAGTSSAATGRFLSNNDDYNVFEVQLNFAGLANGKYYGKISGMNDSGDGTLVVGMYGQSEPIHLKDKWLDTNLIEYSNVDNGYGNITWTTGYIGRIRVESIIGPKRLTAGGERGVSRNSNYDAVKTFAKKVRGILFETFILPPYLHEKLGLIFDCDSFSINGVSYQATEGYADPNYIDEFKLANSSIKLEQLGWNKKYNSNDIGTVVEGGFLTTETGFLKR